MVGISRNLRLKSPKLGSRLTLWPIRRILRSSNLGYTALVGTTLIVTVGCGGTPSPDSQAQLPTTPTVQPSRPPLELLQLSHQRMSSVTSYRAQIDIKVYSEEQEGAIELDVRRGRPGLISVVANIEAPGANQRHELVLLDGEIYIKNNGPEWVSYSLGDPHVGETALWAAELASNSDFFGHLIPNQDVPWETYRINSLGVESIRGIQTHHLEITSDFQEMWDRVEESRRSQFVPAGVVGIAPEVLFLQKESNKMDLWVDDRGYVHQLSMELVLTGGRFIKTTMRGYDFDENITVKTPTENEGRAIEISAPVTPAEDDLGGNSEPSLAPGEVSLEVPELELVSPLVPSSTVQAMTREEVQASLGHGISLHQRNIAGADLSHLHMRGANLRNSNLTNVNFYAADLTQADLRGSNLDGADLTRANLQLAKLMKAQLAGAVLSKLDLEAARLEDINLKGADLDRSYMLRADLTGANLEGANLNRVYLAEANLQNANLRGADLAKAYLRGADLSGADLTDANLEGAILTDAKLFGTILFGADLRGADLSDSHLVRVNLFAAELGSADSEFEGLGSDTDSAEDSNSGGKATIIEGTFFGEGTTWSRAFCGEVFRCTRESLRARGALVN